jgi:hypothetical protein
MFACYIISPIQAVTRRPSVQWVILRQILESGDGWIAVIYQ